MTQLESTLKFLQSSIPEVEHLVLHIDNFEISPELVVKFHKNSNTPDLVLEYYSIDKNFFMLELKTRVLEYLKTEKYNLNLKGKIVWDAGFVDAPYIKQSSYIGVFCNYFKRIRDCFKPKKIVKRSNCGENLTVGFRSKSRIN